MSTPARSMSDEQDSQNWSDGRYTSQDGLRLHTRHYAAASGRPARPVLCLPGLTRNAKDFHVLATRLSQQSEAPRDVHCIDYRGRGRSDHDRDWRNYTPYIELLDTLDYMTVAGLDEAAIVGTSRGGILAMLMGVVRPAAVGPVVLNDIGPVIETGGLARIMGYVGKTPVPASWEEAASLAREASTRFFTNIPDEEWEAVARQWFMEKDGRPAPGYDPRLARAMAEIDLASEQPSMWAQFGALDRVPVLVLRGGNSDLLSEETVERMKARHPRLRRFTVPEQGHAPFLRDTRTLDVLERFLRAND